MILYYVIILLKEVSQTILFINSEWNLMNKTHYSILAIVIVMTLGIAIVTPNIFALEQTSDQSSEQGTLQSQNGVVNILSPQISKQISSQSSTQNACVFVSIVCG